jgi:hypothetical protein
MSRASAGRYHLVSPSTAPTAAAARCASSSRPARPARTRVRARHGRTARAQSDRPTAHPAPRGPGGPGLLFPSHPRRRRNIRAVIPRPADQIAHRKRKGRCGGRPPAFDREAYKRRDSVERCINRLKNWRGLATRYEKTATVFRAGLQLRGHLHLVRPMIHKKGPSLVSGP